MDDSRLDDWFQGVGNRNHDQSQAIHDHEVVPATWINCWCLVHVPSSSVGESSPASVPVPIVGWTSSTSVPVPIGVSSGSGFGALDVASNNVRASRDGGGVLTDGVGNGVKGLGWHEDIIGRDVQDEWWVLVIGDMGVVIGGFDKSSMEVLPVGWHQVGERVSIPSIGVESFLVINTVIELLAGEVAHIKTRMDEMRQLEYV